MKMIGCDFHPGHQQVSILDTETGEKTEMKLSHGDGQVERFYREMEAPTLIGMEAAARRLAVTSPPQELLAPAPRTSLP